MPHYLAFVRHGEYQQRPDTPSAWQPFPLTEKGLAQSRSAADAVYAFAQHHTLDQIIPLCSNLLRAWQTASVIEQALFEKGLDVHPPLASDALNERSVGSVANLSLDDIEQLIAQDPRYSSPPKGWKSNSHYRLPFSGAESLMESGQRVSSHILQHLGKLPTTENTLTLIVGHGASIRHAAHCLGILPFEKIEQLSMFHASPIFYKIETNNNKDVNFHPLSGQWKQRQHNTQFHD